MGAKNKSNIIARKSLCKYLILLRGRQAHDLKVVGQNLSPQPKIQINQYFIKTQSFGVASFFVHGSVSTATCRHATCLKLTRLCLTYAPNVGGFGRINKYFHEKF